MIMNMTGGAPALNFKIVGGVSAPASPRENTIWVNTSVAVTGYALSPEAPEAPEEGMVWIETGALSSAPFNALKKNALQVFPVRAWQYTDDAWSARAAQIYSGGQWAALELQLVQGSKTLYPLKAVGKGRNSVYSAAWSSVSVTPGDTAVTVRGNSAGYGIAYFEDIDLTGYDTLTIEGTFTFNGSDPYRLVVWSKLGTYYEDNVVLSADLGSGGATLDISGLTGVHTMGITSAGTSLQTIENLWLS